MFQLVQLMQFQFSWPVFDLLFLAGVMRWLMLLLIVSGLCWGMAQVFPKLFQEDTEKVKSTKTRSEQLISGL